MKLKHSLLGASVALALMAAPLAQAADTANSILASLHTAEAPRITVAVNTSNLVRIPNTHLTMNVAPSGAVPDTATMNHLQLILQPSAQRQAALKQLIADQHNPQSSGFHQWITPAQYGENFGVTDADIATVTAWLQSQGFTVNNVYPNKTQIDFSGTAGQVRNAFHTQENLYTFQSPASLGSSSSTTSATPITHLSNNSDISIPAALQGVVAGVMGLNDFHAQAAAGALHTAQWNTATQSYQPTDAADIQRQQINQQLAEASQAGGKAQITSYPNSYYTPGIQLLVPFDLNQMYDANALRNAGITGKGVTIAVVEENDMAPSDWANFVSTFNLAQYGGTFAQVSPAPTSGTTNCLDPDALYGVQEDTVQTIADAEWATAMAPGANLVVAVCSNYDANYNPTSTNTFGGVFIAATNEVNLASGRPNILSASYMNAEYSTDSASKTAIDALWAQADSEGISVFVTAGLSGPNTDFYGNTYQQTPINGAAGNPTLAVNSLASSPNDTSVGGTDIANVLDGTTSKYFAATPNAYGGSAYGYVPEIPWNESCANGVAAASLGYSSGLAFCQALLTLDPSGLYAYSHAGGGGRSTIDAKPSWQANIYNAAPDGMRDLPDVALFAGSYNKVSSLVLCAEYYPCKLNAYGQLGNVTYFQDGLSTPMFAGIQALVDQALGSNGTPANQGNAAPTLYALAQQEYGTSTKPNTAGLASCAANSNASYGNTGCVFHNIVRGDISVNCWQPASAAVGSWTTSNCYYYGAVDNGQVALGLTSNDAAPTSYTLTNRAYTARPGYSLAAGLGSVDAANLVSAWQKYAATATTASQP